MTKFHFLPFQEWPKLNFETGKTAKNAISRDFFTWTFLNFMAHCELEYVLLPDFVEFQKKNY